MVQLCYQVDNTPLSSAASALISPGPGPATVRLALIRVGIELFGPEVVQEELFSWIRSARLRVRPPERLAISEQVVRAYKATEKGKAISAAEVSGVPRDGTRRRLTHALHRASPGRAGQVASALRLCRILGTSKLVYDLSRDQRGCSCRKRMCPAVARGERLYSTSAVLFLYPFRVSLSFPLMARCCSTRG